MLRLSIVSEQAVCFSLADHTLWRKVNHEAARDLSTATARERANEVREPAIATTPQNGNEGLALAFSVSWAW